ncbi:MAG TPA: SHOCT domain-containing protein [Planctomycetota bacterium]|nr:SHOCT domain-containing protein [Planctomycetota bacterium]
MGKTEVEFRNFTVLGEEGTAFLAKLLFLWPGIAGLVAIVLAFAMRNVVRSIILMALGIAAFVLPLLDENVGGVRGLVVLLGPGASIALVCTLLGTAVLYAGCRSRCFRPWSRAAAIIGAIGGVVYIVSLVLPERSGGDIGIVQQFKMLDTRRVLVEGIVQLAATGLAVVASVLCFINIPLAPKGQKVGRTAFWLLFVSLLLGYYGMAFVTGLQGGDAPAELIPAILVATLKMVSCVLGTVLLVAVGLADLIVNVSGGGAPAAAAGGPPLYSPRPAAPYGGPSPYAGAPAAPQDDSSARLQRLHDMFARGLISPAEYEQKKNEILSRM